MNMNITILESVIAFRRGANAQGVRVDLEIDQIPVEILNLIQSKKSSKSK